MYLKTQVQITKDQMLDMHLYRLPGRQVSIDIESSTYHYDKRAGESHSTSTGLTLIVGHYATAQVDRLISLLQEARQAIGACDHCEDGTVYDAIQTPDGERREANPCPKCRGTGQL